MRLKKLNSNKGFTVIELLIATSIFSVILLLCAASMLQIGRAFYKGVTVTNTDEVARGVINDISSSITYSSTGIQPLTSVTSGGVTSRGYCIGNTRYSYILGRMLVDDPTKHGLVADRLDKLSPSVQCSSSTPALNLTLSPSSPSWPPNAREMLAPRMRVSKLVVTNPTDSSRLYKISLRLVTGPDDALADKLDANSNPGTDGVLDTCNGFLGGSQFCAAIELTTTIQKRLQ